MFPYFDNQLFSKYIAAFGSMFDNITIVKYSQNHTSRLEQIKVPLIYASKEKYIHRLSTDPTLDRKEQITFPAMGYELTGITFNASRKRDALRRIVNPNADSDYDSVYAGVPYTLSFDLTIASRTQSDAFQIVEQLLPIWQSSFTISIKPIPELNFTDDVVINMESVVPRIEYEGTFDTFRSVLFTLSFTMEVNFYGPTTQKKIIRQAFANVFIDQALTVGSFIRVNLGTGNNGTFQVEDTVYQGSSFDKAHAYGTVVFYNPTRQYVKLGSVRGVFRANANIQAQSTNASYNITSFDAGPYKVLSMQTVPDPIDAEPTDNYGYTETFIEYPDTIDG